MHSISRTERDGVLSTVMQELFSC